MIYFPQKLRQQGHFKLCGWMYIYLKSCNDLLIGHFTVSRRPMSFPTNVGGVFLLFFPSRFFLLSELWQKPKHSTQIPWQTSIGSRGPYRTQLETWQVMRCCRLEESSVPLTQCWTPKAHVPKLIRTWLSLKVRVGNNTILFQSKPSTVKAHIKVTLGKGHLGVLDWKKKKKGGGVKKH